MRMHRNGVPHEHHLGRVQRVFAGEAKAQRKLFAFVQTAVRALYHSRPLRGHQRLLAEEDHHALHGVGLAALALFLQAPHGHRGAPGAKRTGVTDGTRRGARRAGRLAQAPQLPASDWGAKHEALGRAAEAGARRGGPRTRGRRQRTETTPEWEARGFGSGAWDDPKLRLKWVAKSLGRREGTQESSMGEKRREKKRREENGVESLGTQADGSMGELRIGRWNAVLAPARRPLDTSCKA
eukprot:scaffold1060_cov246-Pinguiococcus_pyrenoidosus.AAC.2